MKKSFFDAKKTTLVLATTMLIGFSNVHAGGIPVIDVSAIANQVKDYAMQLQQYEQMYSQLQQQIQMVKMQKQNLENLSREDWQNLSTVLYQVRGIMNRVDGISYDIGNVSKKFESTYKNFSGYSDDLSNANNENERNKLYSERYNEIRQLNQNTFNGTLQQLELQYKDLESEDTLVSKLKERSQNSKGNLQVVQATNDLIAYQIDEIRKLRAVIMDQSNMLTNYLASQNNKDILEQAKITNQMKQDNRSPWGNGKQHDNEAFKWK
ncbi:P-type conjugative transfer protein TrbJ [Campylobacter lari]|nr:P-type conjugative transfer protein TrbJ [Campylobacter lari]